MAIVRITWTDAIGSWSNVWTSLADITAELASTEVVTVGHLVDTPGLDYIVVAVSKTGEGDDATFGGVFAIPKAMLLCPVETLEA